MRLALILIGLCAIGMTSGQRARAQDVGAEPATDAATEAAMESAADAQTQEADEQAGDKELRPSLLKRLTDPDRRFVVVPIPQSNPTIGTGIIVGAGYFHKQSEADEAAGVPNTTTQVAGGYFDTSSWGIVLRHDGYYKQDTWRLSGIGGYLSLNLPFFGIGGEAGDKDQSVGWNLEGWAIWPRVLRRVRGDWFLGGDLRAIDSDSGFNVPVAGERFDRVNENRLEVTSVGLGPRIEYDTRDNTVNAYDGTYFQFSSVFNGRALGSDHTYEIYGVRARRYQLLSPKLTFAMEGKGRFTNGSVPFFDLSRVELRGFPATQYMDNIALQGQVELRWRAHKWFGFTAFGGLGAVAPELSEFQSSTVAWSGGFGLRVGVAPKRRVYLRADFAWSEHD